MGAFGFFGQPKEEAEAAMDRQQEDAERARLVFLLEVQLHGFATESDLAELAVLQHRFRRRSR